ncbi:hypothetical protein [Hansschlegelia sp.]|nr:hypothetical protein [Hansschlegelia sp.]HVI30077.1 hypothetical protein [Hansschlegelia sp.]
MTEPVVKDPLPPEHRRFVLFQAGLRLWIALAILAALGVWFFTRV